MAEFESLRGLSQLFHGGMQNLGSKEYQYRARAGHEVEFDAALTEAGEEFLKYFRAKVDDGSQLATLMESTIDKRVADGIDSDKPLLADGYLYAALDYKVTDHHTLQVGVKNEMHPRPGAEESDTGLIDMESLVEQNELGYTTAATSMFPARYVQPRPIFTAPDFDETATIIAELFAEAVLNNKGQFPHAKFSKDGRR